MRRRTLLGGLAGLAGWGMTGPGLVGCAPAGPPRPAPSPGASGTPGSPRRRVELTRVEVPITPFGEVRESRLLGDLLLVRGTGLARDRFSAIDLGAGREDWTFEVGAAPPPGWPAGLVVRGVLGFTRGSAPLALLGAYAGQRSNERLVAVDARTGQLRWEAAAPWFTAYAHGDDDLVVTSGSGNSSKGLRAYDAKDGRQRWEAPGTGVVSGVTAGAVLAAGTADGPLELRDRASGAVLPAAYLPTNRARWVDRVGEHALVVDSAECSLLDLAAGKKVFGVDPSGLTVDLRGALCSAGGRVDAAVPGDEGLAWWRTGDAGPRVFPRWKGVPVGVAAGVAWVADAPDGAPTPIDESGEALAGGPDAPLELVTERWVVEAVTADLPTIVAHRWGGIR